MLTLRLAAAADARQLWEWANEPSTCAASFRQASIAWSDHERWLAQRLADEHSRLFVAIDDGRPVGQIRFDLQANVAEVHISVAQSERGRGHAAAMLERGCDAVRTLGIDRVIAHVKPENGSSLRLFERAGFCRRGLSVVAGHSAERFERVLRRPDAGARVLFVVDGSASAGLGHVTRTTALAAALHRLAIASTFVASDAPAVIEKVRRSGADHRPDRRNGHGPLDAKEIRDVAAETGSGAIVIDSYAAEARTYSDLARSGLAVIAVDDLAATGLACDVVINGGAQASQLPYPKSPSTRYLLGPAYAMLRPEFWSPAPRVCRPRVSTVGVTTGGGASGPLAERVVSAIDHVDQPFAIDLVQSSFAGATAAGAPSVAHPVRTIVDPPEMAAVLAACDVVICAGGQTIYELAAVGTPAIAIEVAANQHASLAAMAAHGTVEQAGALDAPDVFERITDLLRRLCDSFESRSGMAARGQRLVDGRGAARVALEIERLLQARAVSTAPPATGTR